MRRYTFAIYDEHRPGDGYSETSGEHFIVELISDSEARSYGLHFARDLKRASSATYKNCTMLITEDTREVSLIVFSQVD